MVKFMKIKILFIVLALALFSSCSAKAIPVFDLDLNQLSSNIIDCVPSDFGYCDVGDYYFDSYFGDLYGVKQFRIYRCNESTNFNEIGIFEFESPKLAREAEKIITNYLQRCKIEFENGIIYNADEYPKFKNASHKRIENVIIYTILDYESTKKVIEEFEKYIQNKGQQPLILLLVGKPLSLPPLI